MGTTKVDKEREARWRIAMHHFKQGDWNIAHSFFEGCYEKGCRAAEAYWYRGRCYVSYTCEKGDALEGGDDSKETLICIAVYFFKKAWITDPRTKYLKELITCNKFLKKIREIRAFNNFNYKPIYVTKGWLDKERQTRNATKYKNIKECDDECDCWFRRIISNTT